MRHCRKLGQIIYEAMRGFDPMLFLLYCIHLIAIGL